MIKVGGANWKVGLGLPHLIASHRISSSQVGLGLPLARLYAKYFGGTLHLAPMEGYGTDGYI